MSASVEKIGERICSLRKAHAMTQESLGERLGVSAQAVSKWENGGVPDTYFLPLLAEVFSVTTDELLGFEPPAKTYTKEELYRLLSEAFAGDNSDTIDGCFDAVWAVLQKAAPDKYMDFREAQMECDDKEGMVYSKNYSDEGMVFQSFNEDFPIIWAVRDAEGLTEKLLSNKKLWQFFDDLGNVEFRRLLLFTQSTNDGDGDLLSVDYLAHIIEIPKERMQKIVDRFVYYSLMKKCTAKIDGKDLTLYTIDGNPHILPMLMAAYLAVPSTVGRSAICAYYSRSKSNLDKAVVDSARKNGKI